MQDVSEPAPDSGDELMEILNKARKVQKGSWHNDNQSGPVFTEDWSDTIAAIEAWANARFEQALGADEETVTRSDTPLNPPHVSTSLVVDHAAAARNALRAKARTRWEKGDGNE